MKVAPSAIGEMGAERLFAPLAPGPAGRRPRTFDMRLAIAACLALAAISLAVPYTLDYDPWNWVSWGREIGHLTLDTRGGTAWKPLPVLFTSVFSLAGGAAPGLWVVVARAGALLALLLAYRLGARLAGPLAGAVAALSLALVDRSIYYFYLGNSEGLLVALVLWAIERHLAGRSSQALLLAFAASLLRPEVWPFFAAYAVVLWVRRGASRRLVAAVLVALPLLWLGPEWWASGDPLGGSQRVLASMDAREIQQASHPWLVVIARALGMLPPPVTLAALAGAAIAVRRRERTLLALAAGAGAWVAVVAAMAERGYPGIPRFMVPAAAIGCVLAGVAVARAREAVGRGRPRAALGALLVVSGLVAAATAEPQLHQEAVITRYQVGLENQLLAAVRRVGGPERILRCGTPNSPPLQVAVLDWALHHRAHVEYDHRRPPMMIFRARPYPHQRPVPAIPRAAHLRLVARVGRWRVLANCHAPQPRPA